LPKRDLVRTAAILILGVLFPVLILAQAWSGLASLGRDIDRSMKPEQVVEILKGVRPLVRSANDYALYSEMYAENVNQTVITNKQIIKVVVMQIGFAAMSLGLMFVLLGVNDGGGEGHFGWAGGGIDFKTSSTGALVFLVGAMMATAGGVLKNEYKSIPLPQYIEVGAAGPSDAEAQSLEAYQKCQSAGREFPACFASLYGQINAGRLK
jgi:hypothetical protein